MRSWILPATLAVLSIGCARPRYTAAPSDRERELRDVGPHEVELFPSGAGPECEAALRRSDAATEAGDLVAARAAVDEAGERCGQGFAVHYRRGWIARAEGDSDRAARAYIDELSGPRPAFVAGAQLLDVLPEARWATRRSAARLGGARNAVHGGFEGVDSDRLAEMRCGGRPARLFSVGCRPGTYTYTYGCKGGGRVRIRSANDYFGLVGEPL